MFEFLFVIFHRALLLSDMLIELKGYLTSLLIQLFHLHITISPGAGTTPPCWATSLPDRLYIYAITKPSGMMSAMEL